MTRGSVSPHHHKMDELLHAGDDGFGHCETVLSPLDLLSFLYVNTIISF